MTLSPGSEPLQPNGQQNRQQKLLLTAAICLAYVSFALVANGWGPLMPPLGTQLALPLDQVGLLFVAWSVGYLPGTLVGGSLLDRYGPRRVLFFATCILLSGITAVLVGVSFHVLPLLGLTICAGVAGMGGGTIDASTNGLISALYASQRGVALNLFTLLYPLSSMLISFIDGGLLLFFRNDPRPPLLFTSGMVSLAMLFVLLLPRAWLKNASDFQPDASSIQRGRIRRLTVLFPLLLPVITAMLLTTGFTATIRTWTPSYLHVRYGQTAPIAALLSGLTNGLVVLFRLLASLLITRIGTVRTVLVGILVAVAGLVMLLWSPNVILGTVAITITAIGLTPLVATFVSIGSDRVGTMFGSVSGVLFFVTGISNIVCSWLFGVLLTQAGSTWALIFCLLCMICGGSVAVSLQRNPIQKTM